MEEFSFLHDLQNSLPVLPLLGPGNFPAQQEGSQLHTIADAQYRYTQLKNLGRAAGAPSW